MDNLKLFFPFSFKTKDTTELIVAIVIYIVIGAIAGLVLGFLTWIPVLGYVFTLIGSILGIYTFVGIVLAVLNYFNLLK